MDSLDEVLTSMDLEFVGSSRHKVGVEALLADKDALLLDVRTTQEAATVSLGFVYHLSVVNIPLHLLPQQFEQLPKDKVVGIFCPHAVRASVAYTYLRARGFDNVLVLEGGYAALTEQARPGKVLAQLDKARK